MEYPRLTQDQLLLNNAEFNALIQNVRRYNSGVADLLMQNLFKIDQHVKAQEAELVIIEQLKRELAETLGKIEQHKAHAQLLLARMRKTEARRVEKLVEWAEKWQSRLQAEKAQKKENA